MLDLERIGTCPAHVLEGSPKVVHRAGMILPLEALGRLLQAKALYYLQGRDVDSANYGSNIFLPNNPPYRTKEYGFSIGSGAQTKTAVASFLLSYEVKQNLFLEAHALYRKETSASPQLPSENTVVISAGIRWNMHRREFDF